MPSEMSRRSLVQLGLAAGTPLRVQRGAQEIRVADAGQLHRILERQEYAGGGAGLGRHRQQILAVERYAA